VSCPTAEVCEAAGVSSTGNVGFLLRTVTAGATWKLQKAPAGVSSLSDVVCPSTQICEASGTKASLKGAALVTTDGGSSWTSQTLPTTVAALTGLSCPSAVVCYGAASTTQGTGVLLKLDA
jgi:photosystem II stability/assembly factor-like uncharacterized protein